MLRFVLDHLKTKNMCRTAVKQLLLVIKYVPDRYMTKEMTDKVISQNGGKAFFLTATRITKICDQALRFDPDSYKAQNCVIKPLVLMLLQCNLFLIERNT